MKTGTRLRPLPEREGGRAVEVISSPLNPSEPRHRSPSAMWLASSGLSVPRPQLLFARATTAAVLSLMNFTTSIAGFREIAVITSAANGLLITRPVMPALAQTSCCSSKSVMS